MKKYKILEQNVYSLDNKINRTEEQSGKGLYRKKHIKLSSLKKQITKGEL